MEAIATVDAHCKNKAGLRLFQSWGNRASKWKNGRLWNSSGPKVAISNNQNISSCRRELLDSQLFVHKRIYYQSSPLSVYTKTWAVSSFSKCASFRHDVFGTRSCLKIEKFSTERRDYQSKRVTCTLELLFTRFLTRINASRNIKLLYCVFIGYLLKTCRNNLQLWEFVFFACACACYKPAWSIALVGRCCGCRVFPNTPNACE